MKEYIDKYLELLLNCSFNKKETEDIFYNFVKIMEVYYDGKYRENI